MITFKQFLDEARMSKGVFAAAIERMSGSAKMGFELEMWVPEESDLLIVSTQDSSKGDFMATAKMAKDSLEDLLGYSVRINGESINQWRIVPDGSIQEGGLGCGIEIISPPDPVEDSLGDLKMLFKWMVKHEVVTNSTTGLHLNLSIPDIKEKLDPLKLILFMGEAHVLKSYDRKLNTYAQEHRADLMAALSEYASKPESASMLKAMAGSALKKMKYRTVNLMKLDAGYLEFRTAGNTDYHKKLNQVTDDVGRFLTILELACDPEAEKQEYLKKLAKLFGASQTKKQDDVGANPRDTLQTFISSQAGGAVWGRLEHAVEDGTDAKQALYTAMYWMGKLIYQKQPNISTKMIAEFKTMLNKIHKHVPDAFEKAKTMFDNETEQNALKAFMKAFNLK